MDYEKYRQKLVEKKRKLTDPLSRSVVAVREERTFGGLDGGEESVHSQQKKFVAAQAAANTQLLEEVEATLKRIGEENRTIILVEPI